MRTLTCILLASAAAMAQTSVVFPSDHAAILNGSSYIAWFPFSSDAPFRGQIVYEDWDLGLAPNTPITRIGFRQDGANASASRQIVMEMRMGITNENADTLGTTFDNNWASASTVVYPQSLFVLPALTAVTPNSTIWVDLPNPYLYPGGNLLVEVRVFLNNNGNQAFNYYLDRATFVSPVTSGVQGCLHSGGQRPVLASSPTEIGGNWNFQLTHAPANTPLALLIAPGQQMVAPYSLSILGLDPSCQGQLPLSFVAFSASSNSSGNASWSVPVPNSLSFNDAFMTSQVVAFDFFVPGYLVVSNADQVQFGVDPAMTLLRGLGSATATTGTVYRNYGLVTLFN